MIKTFLLKSLSFSIPVIVLFIISLLFYSPNKGDLFRIGYVWDSGYDRKEIFKTEYERDLYYTEVSDIDFNKRNKYTVLTIGDSFSEQKEHGYQSYLAEDDNISTLHFDRFLHDNPIQTLYSLLNGDFFNYVQVDYIILQSVERHVVERAQSIRRNKILLKDSITELIDEKEKKSEEVEQVDENFFSDRILKFPVYNILYFFDDNAFVSRVHRAELDENLFSNNKEELYFYKVDLEKVEVNNDLEKVRKLNKELNNLSALCKEKGIQLVVMPSPDKYDFYYQNIVKKAEYPKPLFFNFLDTMPKKYIYIDSKTILSDLKKTEKDLYFYDDTHWSPKASKIIAKNLKNLIR